MTTLIERGVIALLALLRRRKRPPYPGYGPRSPWAAANRKHPWSPLAQELVALHIADASDLRRERKGWADA